MHGDLILLDLFQSRQMQENIVDFIKSNIILPFNNKLMISLCEKFSFKQQESSIYNAHANGLTEVFNNILGNLLKKVVAKNKRD